MAEAMLQLSSIDDVLANIAAAKAISVQAYTLRGPMLAALGSAARRGAHVTVELERDPFDDGKRYLAGENARIAAQLCAAGARARLEDHVHAKSMVVDGTLYLDEKNWREGDIVLRGDQADAASIPMTKEAALAQEGALLATARHNDAAIVESESFGAGNATYDALKALGAAGAHPRLLVSESDLRGNRRERAVLQDLCEGGVRVRLCQDSAKLALIGERAWLGSANSTYAGKGFKMSDWGVCTQNGAIVDAVRKRLEAQWQNAKEFRARRA